MTEYTLERNGCPIHYWTAGNGAKPLVVFTHGAYIDHREWDATLPLITATGFRVLSWDVRGHGKSRPGVFHLKDALDDLIAVLDATGVEQATFVGHSMGGNLHQELVFHHPERVKALVMLDCTWNFQKLSRAEAFGVKIGVPLLGWYPYQTLINQMADVTATRPADRAYLREAFSVLTKAEFVQIMAEALLLASVGTAFGILSGMYLGYVIVKALGTLFPITYSFPLSGVLAGIAIGLLFGALAAVIPARQAARLQVVEALRHE